MKLLSFNMGFMSTQHSAVLEDIKAAFPHYRITIEHHLGSRLFLDIFMPDISIGVEVNGVQHYKFVPFFHGSQIKFEEYKFLDKKKVRLCNEQGIGLYVVKHDEAFDTDDFMEFVFMHLKNSMNGSDKIGKG